MADFPKEFNRPPPAFEPLRALLVQERQDELLQTASKSARLPFSWVTAISQDEAVSYLKTLLQPVREGKKARWLDLTILDPAMFDPDRCCLLEFIRTTPETKDLPVVVLADRDAGQLAMKLGANFVFRKPRSPVEAQEIVLRIFLVYRIVADEAADQR